MKAILMVLLMAGLFIILLHEPTFGHGGQFRGPGGTGPPNLGGPSTKLPVSSSGDAVGPSQPAGTATTGAGGKKFRGGAGGMQGKKWTAYQQYDRWEFWWEYNKDTYLNLKNTLFGNTWVKGSGGFLSGRRSKDEFRTSRLATVDIMKKEVLPFLIESLKIDHPDVQDSSVLAMARITNEKDAVLVIEHIRELLASKYQTVQQSACLSLGVLGSATAIPLCRDLMFDTAAGKKLAGESKVPRLVRSFAALSLGLIGSGDAVPELIRVIELESASTHKDLHSCAFTALGLLGDTDRSEEIVRFLSRKLMEKELDPFLKAFIPVALGKLGNHDALEELVSLFREENLNEWVRQSTAIAIGQLAELDQDGEVPKLLMDYVKKGKDVKTKHLCFIALAQIGARDRDYSQRADLHGKISKFFLTEIEEPSRFSHTAWASLGAAIHAMPHEGLHGAVIEKIRKTFRDTRNPSNKGAFAISLGLLNADSCASMLPGAGGHGYRILPPPPGFRESRTHGRSQGAGGSRQGPSGRPDLAHHLLGGAGAGPDRGRERHRPPQGNRPERSLSEPIQGLCGGDARYHR
jgi:HEAT repeat protein